MTIMRSVLYVPGNKEDMIAKSPKAHPDIITLDIEDSVPPAEKERSREISRSNYKVAASLGADVYVRVNGWETGLTNADLEVVVDKGLTGITLPKCAGPDEVKRIDWKIEEMEQRRGLEIGSIRLQLLIETAKGAMNVYQSALASKRVNALIFGAVDYTTDMRVTLVQPMGEEQNWTRACVAVAARATGVVAIDCPYVGFKDIEGFEKDTQFGRQYGYEGRMLIHPSQIEPSHRVYTPSPERVAWAREVVKVFEEEGIAKGSAAVPYKGEMVDTPVYYRGKKILEVMAEIEAKGKGA